MSLATPLADGDDLAVAVSRLLHPASHDVEILALGEPTHLEPAFAHARNALLRALVDAGVRSVALESDAVRALAADDAVRGDAPPLDRVPAEWFSHGFGEHTANQDLVRW